MTAQAPHQGRSIVAVATPGHTADHISILVRDDHTTYFLAGDTSYADYHQHFHGRGPSPSRGPFSAVSDFLLLTIFSQKVQLAQGRLPTAVPSLRPEDFFRPPRALLGRVLINRDW